MKFTSLRVTKTPIHFALLILFLAGAAVACEPQIPAPPQITVNITAVDDQEAVDDAVNATLTGIAQQRAYIRETEMALGGITLTPSLTFTATFTPLPPTETRTPIPTRTPVPSDTPTSTYVPYLTNTPQPPPENIEAFNQETARIRVLHAWNGTLIDSERSDVDVFVNDTRIARALALGQSTAYIQINPGVARLTLRRVDAESPDLPYSGITIDAPPASSTTLLIVDPGPGLTIVAIPDDPSPLASDKARLSIYNANPRLVPSNLLLVDQQRSLATNFVAGDFVGPFDLPQGRYPIQLQDAQNPELMLTILEGIDLKGQANYLLVLLPPPNRLTLLSSMMFAGATRSLPIDSMATFINSSVDLGTVQIRLDDRPVYSELPPGQITPPLPVGNNGSTIDIEQLATGRRVTIRGLLGPWSDLEATLDKIILITENPLEGVTDPAERQRRITTNVRVFVQNPRPSAIRTNIRLIHGLSGTTRSLDLEFRAVRFETVLNSLSTPVRRREDTDWIPIVENISYGDGSEYVVRSPDTFDVRVVISGTQSVVAEIEAFQLLAGGVYDFVAIPSDQPGQAKLLLIQPNAQVSNLALKQGDPEIVAEIVAATQTALAPAIIATSTPFRTPTPTISPIPTNTPGPTNTPDVPLPSILVNPIPPNTTRDSFIMVGQNFAPGRAYSVRLDGNPQLVASGNVREDGTISVIVRLPATISPGPHVVRVCVDCIPLNGAKQEAFAVINVADPVLTPTATPHP